MECLEIRKENQDQIFYRLRNLENGEETTQTLEDAVYYIEKPVTPRVFK